MTRPPPRAAVFRLFLQQRVKHMTWLEMDTLLWLRGWLAVGGLLLFMGIEHVWAFRPRVQRWWRHYAVNVLISGGNAVLIRLVWGTWLVGAAVLAERQGAGLLHLADVPWGLRVAITVLFYDALTYVLHVLYHYLPVMWRLHQVHHTDLDYDVTTASRFHFGEILFSTAVQTGAAFALGASPEGLVLFQILLLFQAQFQHSNLRYPDGVDRVLRWVMVTPNMHRVHHSTVPDETNSNFATILSVWDRLGGTFRWGQRQEDIRIGLDAFPSPDEVTLPKLLVMPFRPLRPDPNLVRHANSE